MAHSSSSTRQVGTAIRKERVTPDSLSAHCSVGREDREAKFWLMPVRLARPGRMKAIELREIERIIDENLDFMLNTWRQEQQKRANR